MNTETKIYTKIIIVLTMLSITTIAVADEQADRIKEMGFVSISDSEGESSEGMQDSESIVIPKRVPQPKVINIPTKKRNPYVNRDNREPVEQYVAIQEESEDVFSGFVEVDEPIIVNGSGAFVEKGHMEVEIDYSDEELEDDTDIIYRDVDVDYEKYNQDTEVLSNEAGMHQKDAYNYYNYEENDSEFKHKYVGHKDRSASLSDLEKIHNPPPPVIEVGFQSLDKQNGLPGIDIKARVTTGYRVDDLDWNIAADLTGSVEPNILSELTWSDLQMIETKGKVEIVLLDNWVIDAKAGWGQIIDGDNQDSDYLDNNRGTEFSRSNNSSDDGHVWDYSIGAGYRMHIENPDPIFYVDDLWVTFLAGYSRHKQQLVIQDGNQTIAAMIIGGPFITPELGPFSGLESRYNAQFEGPWVGLEFEGIRKRFRGYGRFEYHFPDYQGDANWNLRSDFVQPGSFTHWSNKGYGIVFDFGTEYYINNTWSASLSLVYQDWEIGAGVDRVYFSNQSFPFIDTRLNEVNWQSTSITFGLTAHF